MIKTKTLLYIYVYVCAHIYTYIYIIYIYICVCVLIYINIMYIYIYIADSHLESYLENKVLQVNTHFRKCMYLTIRTYVNPPQEHACTSHLEHMSYDIYLCNMLSHA